VLIGVLGGTFDPVHLGHLAAAEAVRDSVGLDQVLFVPNWHQPLKLRAPAAGSESRRRMLDAAIRDNPGFALDDVELRLGRPAYTIETLDILRLRRPTDRLRFILGVDALIQFAAWREPRRLIEEYAPIAMLRAGWPGPDWRALRALHPDSDRLIRVIEVPGLDIASRDVRARVAAGQSIRYLVPEAVREVISRDGLYRLDAPSSGQ
jgi:nicotinate-nucleotide adenylyltransferase